MRDHLEADHPASEDVDVVQVVQREKLRDVRSLQGATQIVSLREEEEQIQWVVEVGAAGLGLLMLVGLHRVIVLCGTLIQEGFRAIGFSRVRVRAIVFRGSSSSDLQRAKARKARSLTFFTHTVSRGPVCTGTNRLLGFS